MQDSRRRSCLASCLLVVALVGGAPPGRSAEVNQSTSETRGAVLVEDRILMPGRPAFRPPLPGRTRLSVVRDLEGGWLAAGSRVLPEGEEIFLLAGDADGVRSLPVPEGRPGMLRGGAIPLVDLGRLVGLAWLEGRGATSLAVRAATWDGSGWGAPETVSPPGPGSQVGVTGVTLPGGDLLLAWSAFDGRDDEIIWSRRWNGRWSEPRPAHPGNEFPDVTPTLVATDQGALLAWSQYDGDTYRVRVARYESDSWWETGFRGPPASLRPGWVTADRALYLLFRTVVPETWTLLELDSDGRAWRGAVAAESNGERPVVVSFADSGVHLRWTGHPVSGQEREGTAQWEPIP